MSHENIVHVDPVVDDRCFYLVQRPSERCVLAAGHDGDHQPAKRSEPAQTALPAWKERTQALVAEWEQRAADMRYRNRSEGQATRRTQRAATAAAIAVCAEELASIDPNPICPNCGPDGLCDECDHYVPTRPAPRPSAGPDEPAEATRRHDACPRCENGTLVCAFAYSRCSSCGYRSDAAGPEEGGLQ